MAFMTPLITCAAGNADNADMLNVDNFVMFRPPDCFHMTAWHRLRCRKAESLLRIRHRVTKPGLHTALHSEAIWGVMIALVFFAIFEPHDENKSWWGRPKCQKKIFFKNIFEIFLRKIKYLKNIFHISKGKQHFWALWWKWKLTGMSQM